MLTITLQPIIFVEPVIIEITSGTLQVFLASLGTCDPRLPPSSNTSNRDWVGLPLTYTLGYSLGANTSEVSCSYGKLRGQLLQGWDSNPRSPDYAPGEVFLSIVSNFFLMQYSTWIIHLTNFLPYLVLNKECKQNSTPLPYR